MFTINCVLLYWSYHPARLLYYDFGWHPLLPWGHSYSGMNKLWSTTVTVLSVSRWVCIICIRYNPSQTALTAHAYNFLRKCVGPWHFWHHPIYLTQFRYSLKSYSLDIMHNLWYDKMLKGNVPKMAYWVTDSKVHHINIIYSSFQKDITFNFTDM